MAVGRGPHPDAGWSILAVGLRWEAFPFLWSRGTNELPAKKQKFVVVFLPSPVLLEAKGNLRGERLIEALRRFPHLFPLPSMTAEDGKMGSAATIRAVLAILQWWGFNVTVIIMNKWIFQVTILLFHP
jgi:hypothetical protein